MNLLIHMKDGMLIPYYEGDYSSLESIDKECEKLREKYKGKIDFIELIMSEDNKKEG